MNQSTVGFPFPAKTILDVLADHGFVLDGELLFHPEARGTTWTQYFARGTMMLRVHHCPHVDFETFWCSWRRSMNDRGSTAYWESQSLLAEQLDSILSTLPEAP